MKARLSFLVAVSQEPPEALPDGLELLLQAAMADIAATATADSIAIRRVPRGAEADRYMRSPRECVCVTGVRGSPRTNFGTPGGGVRGCRRRPRGGSPSRWR